MIKINIIILWLLLISVFGCNYIFIDIKSAEIKELRFDLKHLQRRVGNS